jgi:hypothetical protein
MAKQEIKRWVANHGTKTNEKFFEEFLTDLLHDNYHIDQVIPNWHSMIHNHYELECTGYLVLVTKNN